MAGYEMRWKSAADETFDIALAESSKSGYWAKKVDGFSSEVDTSTLLRSTGIGEDSTGLSIPAMTGEIDVVISPRSVGSMLTLPEAWTQFSRAFSQLYSGTLTISQADGQILSARHRLEKPIPAPEYNPHSKRIRFAETTISLVSEDGVWSGMTDGGVITPSGEVRLLNSGDLPAYVDITFTHGAVRFGDGPMVTLPTVSEPRVLSTDPGTGYRITDPETGEVDVNAWASMRGRPVAARILPRRMVHVETTGDVTVSLTPTFTTPWR